jgi:hypothetical protein
MRAQIIRDLTERVFSSLNTRGIFSSTQIYNTDSAGGVKLAVVRVCVLFFTVDGVDASRAKPVIVEAWALEIPPPGVGLTTVTWAIPAVAMSAAVIAAVTNESVFITVRSFTMTFPSLSKEVVIGKAMRILQQVFQCR